MTVEIAKNKISLQLSSVTAKNPAVYYWLGDIARGFGLNPDTNLLQGTGMACRRCSRLTQPWVPAQKQVQEGMARDFYWVQLFSFFSKVSHASRDITLCLSLGLSLSLSHFLPLSVLSHPHCCRKGGNDVL
jgi:hypothetical protein